MAPSDNKALRALLSEKGITVLAARVLEEIALKCPSGDRAWPETEAAAAAPDAHLGCQQALGTVDGGPALHRVSQHPSGTTIKMCRQAALGLVSPL